MIKQLDNTKPSVIHNPSVRVSHTTRVVCHHFIREWRDLQFIIDNERQIFEKTLRSRFINSSKFLTRKYFYFSISCWCLTRALRLYIDRRYKKPKKTDSHRKSTEDKWTLEMTENFLLEASLHNRFVWFWKSKSNGFENL